MLEKTEGAITNGQSRDWKHWAHKTSDQGKLEAQVSLYRSPDINKPS